MLRRAPVTLALCAACLLLAGADAALAEALAWQRGSILHGELWRLWSGHLVHFSAQHAGADTLALLAAGMLAEPPLGARRFALLLMGGAALLSLGLLAGAPSLAEYRGASGVATMTAALAGALAWRRHARFRPLLGLAALALAAKTGWEAAAVHGGGLVGLPAGVIVAWQAHLLGALLGWMLGWMLCLAPVSARARRPAGLGDASAPN